MVFGELRDNEIKLSPKEKFRNQTFIPIIDSLIIELNKSIAVYEEINKKFSFIFQLPE